MNKLLVLFLDGYHPDYLRHPSASALRELVDGSDVAELEPVLGFSNANKASLFTGLEPKDHEQWSYFQYDPEGSPFKGWGTRAFKWIDHVPVDLVRKGAKFTLSKTLVRKWGKANGYPNLSWENVPIGLLHHFDHTERDVLADDDVPSLFRVARDNGLNAEWVDVPWYPRDAHFDRVDRALAENDVVVVYNANMDAAGHWFGPEPSARFDSWAERTDRLVRRVRGLARERWGRDHETALLSDHGMAHTTRHVDLLKRLRELPGLGSSFVPFVDATMARFWFMDDNARRRVERVMEDVGHGHWLTRDEARAYGVDFSHNRYGDAIFLLDPDTVFYPAYVSWVKPRGMHGYAPTEESQTAVFATTAGGDLPGRVAMTDVLPRLVRALDLPRTGDGPGSVARTIDGGMRHHSC